MLEARDIMTKGVITVGPDTSVREVTRSLLENRISAVPVIDGANRVLGIVSEGDLMRRSEIGTEKGRSWWLDALAETSELAHAFVKSHGVKASEIMTSNVITVDQTASIAEIAEILEDNNIKRVPVVRKGKLAGIVSRSNLLQALSAQKETVIELPLKDYRDIRERLMDTLAGEAWADLAMINVVVTNGKVRIWGVVDTDDQRQALRVAAEGVPGVREIEDHTAFRPPHMGAD